MIQLASELLQLLLAAAVAGLLAGLVWAPPARAGDVTLWACHGPAGQPLGNSALVPSSAGDGATMTYGAACSGGLGAGGVLATFGRPDPVAGSSAAWQAAVPIGTTLKSVVLNRTTTGFGGRPLAGDPLLYQASTSSGPLESASVADASNAPLSGPVELPAAGGYAAFGVRCGQAPGGRCASPGAATVGVQVSSLALRVADANPPDVAVGGVASPVSGPLRLGIRATDDGVGLRSATATFDGQPAVTIALGGASCAPLATSASGIDLALGADCPTSVTDVPLNVNTTVVPDGPHQLTVTVTDAAGNTTTAVDQQVVVRNHPDVPGSSVTLAVGTGGKLPAPGAGGGSPGAGGNGRVCLSPQLSAALASRPLRVTRNGVAVLSGATRYLFIGRLTCLLGSRRVGAQYGTLVDILSLIGRRPARRRTGAAVYGRKGWWRVLLHPASTRTLEFHVGFGRTGATVWIPIKVTMAKGGR